MVASLTDHSGPLPLRLLGIAYAAWLTFWLYLYSTAHPFSLMTPKKSDVATE